MRYRVLRLHNWMPFYGTHEIRFSTDPDKPVTLIFGANGGGKTALIASMYWCLYNTTEIDPDGSNAPLDLMNHRAQREIDPGNQDSAWVELEFSLGTSDENRYTVKREIVFTRPPNDGKLQFGNKVLLTDRQGEQIYEHHSDALVRNVLKKDLAKYFFHVGEEMQWPFPTNAQGQREFQAALFNAVGQEEIDIVADQATAHLAALNAERNTVAAQVHEAQEDDAVIAELEEQLGVRRANLTIKTGELSAANTLLDHHVAELAKAEEFRPLKEARDRAIADAEVQKVRCQEKESSLTLLSKQLWRVPATNLVEKFCAWYVERATAFPLIVNQNVVLHVAEGGICICGREASEEHVTNIRNLLEDLAAEDQAAVRIPALYEAAKKLAGEAEGFATDFRLKRAELGAAEAELEDLSAAVDAAEEAIVGFQGPARDADVEALQASVAALRTDRDLLEGECAALDVDIQDIELRKAAAEQRRAGAARNDLLRAVDARIIATRMVRDLAIKVKSAHSQLCRPNLETLLNENYWIIRPEREVRVTEDWEVLTVDVERDGDGKIIGERKIRPAGSEKTLLTYAFAAAMAKLVPQFKLAGIGEIPDDAVEDRAGTYPLVVDAPLTSFGPNYKTRVCIEAPRALDQLVLLNEGQDLGSFGLMLSAGQIGKLYTVKYTGPLDDMTDPEHPEVELLTSFDFADNHIEYLVEGPENSRQSELLELEVAG